MNSFAPWYPKRFELKITLVLPLSITFWSLHLVSKTSVWLFDLNFHDRRPLIPRKYRGPCIWVGGRRTHYLPQWRFSLSHLISHRSAHQHNSNLLLAFYDQCKKVWSTNTQSRFASVVFLTVSWDLQAGQMRVIDLHGWVFQIVNWIIELVAKPTDFPAIAAFNSLTRLSISCCICWRIFSIRVCR